MSETQHRKFPLEEYNRTVAICESYISTNKKTGQFGSEDSDKALRLLSKRLSELKQAIKEYEEWTATHKGTGWRSSIARKLQKVLDRDPFKEAKKTLIEAHNALKEERTQSEFTTAQRDPEKPKGPFRALSGGRVLLSKDRQPCYLTGRFEETGREMYYLVTHLLNIETSSKSFQVPQKVKTKEDQAKLKLKQFFDKLVTGCDEIIAFMVWNPYDLKAFEAAVEEMHRLADILRRYVVDFKNQKDLFAAVNPTPETITTSSVLKNVPDFPEVLDYVDNMALEKDASFSAGELLGASKDGAGSSSSDNESIRPMQYFEQLLAEAEGVKSFLSQRRAAYDEKREIFRKSSSSASASLRSIPKLDLKAGDLRDSQKVVACITRAREQKGLGLSSYSVGAEPAEFPRTRGGYGSVYKMSIKGVKGSTESRVYAVKVIMDDCGTSQDQEALDNLRMLREADRWSAVSSDPDFEVEGSRYLVQVEGIWTPQFGRPGLLSLWAEEGNLDAYMREGVEVPDEKKERTKKKRQLTVKEKIDLVSKIALGVKYLHTRKHPIVHGDLKPANILMYNGEPRLTDFGIALCLDGSHGFTTRDDAYTSGYKAPEVRYRDKSLIPYPTRESDVFAFGCVFFQILTENPPFNGLTVGTAEELMGNNPDMTPIGYFEHSTNEKDRPVFDPEYTKLMNRCFNFHASKRPTMTTVAEMVKELPS